MRTAVSDWQNYVNLIPVCDSYHCIVTGGIGLVNWIVSYIRIEVDLIVIPDRVDLQEPPERGREDAGLVVVHAELGDPRLAGIGTGPGCRIWALHIRHRR